MPDPGPGSRTPTLSDAEGRVEGLWIILREIENGVAGTTNQSSVFSVERAGLVFERRKREAGSWKREAGSG